MYSGKISGGSRLQAGAVPLPIDSQSMAAAHAVRFVAPAYSATYIDTPLGLGQRQGNGVLQRQRPSLCPDGGESPLAKRFAYRPRSVIMLDPFAGP